jgi:hypothetical protein
LVLLVRCRARCQRTRCFAARVGFCAASFLNFDLSRDFAACSVPVLSAAKPWFSQGFSHFWPIALEFCSAHATRCMAPAALYFASRTPNRVVFRVARVVKTLGIAFADLFILVECVGGRNRLTSSAIFDR